MERSGQKKIPRHDCGQQVKKNRSRFIQGHHLKFLASTYKFRNTENLYEFCRTGKEKP